MARQQQLVVLQGECYIFTSEDENTEFNQAMCEVLKDFGFRTILQETSNVDEVSQTIQGKLPFKTITVSFENLKFIYISVNYASASSGEEKRGQSLLLILTSSLCSKSVGGALSNLLKTIAEISKNNIVFDRILLLVEYPLEYNQGELPNPWLNSRNTSLITAEFFSPGLVKFFELLKSDSVVPMHELWYKARLSMEGLGLRLRNVQGKHELTFFKVA